MADAAVSNELFRDPTQPLEVRVEDLLSRLTMAEKVTLMAGTEPSEELRKELVAWVRKDIGPIASPDLIQFAPGLPKTRSGKIMRRILRKIAEGQPDQLGDISTLADPSVVADLIEGAKGLG